MKATGKLKYHKDHLNADTLRQCLIGTIQKKKNNLAKRKHIRTKKQQMLLFSH